MKQFISVQDVGDVAALATQALAYKQSPLKDQLLGKGKRLGMLFFNASMRTRLSTQLAAANLGMEAIVFNADTDGWKIELQEDVVMNGTTVEHIKDAARVLGTYFDILCVRSFPTLVNKEEDYSEALLHQLIHYTGVPIVSLESATLHPLQSLADIITIQEHSAAIKRPKVVLTWAPHVKPIPQCVANSFAQWVNAWGAADFVITHPEGYELHPDFSGKATILHDQKKALEGADFVYVKNWSSYADYGKVLSTDPAWMLTNEHLKGTNDARVMHCLPVRRNIELSDEILDGTNSIVTQLAGNRVFSAQAVLADILKDMPCKS